MSTATAQGRSLPCDYASCNRPATIEVDAWGYCADHAGAARAEAAAPAPTAASPRPLTVTTHPAAATPTPLTIGELLEDASGHSNSRVRRLATRIEEQLDALRGLIASLAADEAAKRAEKAAKDRARQEVARLEAQLAAARAVLRGKPRPTSNPGAAAAGSVPPASTGEYACGKGCGRTFSRPQGRGKHELSCSGATAHP